MSLKFCSLAARGLWIEMMSIMGISEKNGFLQIGGKPITNEQLAIMSGVSVDVVNPLMDELERNGVFSRDENGVPYSRRMVRDFEAYEQGKKYGKRGGNPRLKKEENSESKSYSPEAKGRITGGDNPLDDWKNSFEVYKQQELAAFQSLVNDAEWVAEQQKFNPQLDIMLSLEKAHTQFWGTEAGWKHKKAKRSKEINWKTTYQNALSMTSNKVYRQRDSVVTVKAKMQKQVDRNEVIEQLVDKLWKLRDNDEEFKRQMSVARDKYNKEFGNNKAGQSILDEVMDIIKFRKQQGWE